jgi:ribose 5-phosphate isomerase A
VTDNTLFFKKDTNGDQFMSNEESKKAVGEAACLLIEPNMLIGLGTGSTASFFIESLANFLKNKPMPIKAVASSKATYELAKRSGIPLVSIEDISEIDLYFDGADEIDAQKNMIKGKGGALLREKILASIASEMIVLVDESKLVRRLGMKGYLPVEVVPFASKITEQQLEDEGYVGAFRRNENHEFFMTENNNHLFDIHLPEGYQLEEADHQRIIQIPGVIETGFFSGFAGRVIVGYHHKKVEILD